MSRSALLIAAILPTGLAQRLVAAPAAYQDNQIWIVPQIQGAGRDDPNFAGGTITAEARR